MPATLREVVATIHSWHLIMHVAPSIVLAALLCERAWRLASPINTAGGVFVAVYGFVRSYRGPKPAGRLWCAGAAVHEIIVIVLQCSFSAEERLTARLRNVADSPSIPPASLLAGVITGAQPLSSRFILTVSLLLLALRSAGLLIAYTRLASRVPIDCLVRSSVPFSIGVLLILSIPARWRPRTLINTLERVVLERGSMLTGLSLRTDAPLPPDTHAKVMASDGITAADDATDGDITPQGHAARRVIFDGSLARQEVRDERVASLNALVSGSVAQLRGASSSPATHRGHVVPTLHSAVGGAAWGGAPPTTLHGAESPNDTKRPLTLQLASSSGPWRPQAVERDSVEQRVLRDAFVETVLAPELRAGRVAAHEVQFDHAITLGSGHFGTVHVGQWLRADGYPPVRVAVKVMHRHRIRNGSHGRNGPIELFKRALSCELALPPHAHVARTHCWAVEPETYSLMLVMELCDRGSMQTALELGHSRRWSNDYKLLLARQLAAGLAHLHASTPAIIHRDLKPDNILFDAQENCKICDLGASRYVDIDRTMSNVVGAPLFCAPEQLCHLRYDASVDIFSIGCVLTCLATDRVLPYGEGDAADDGLLRRVSRGETLPALPPSHALHGVVRDCCRYDAAERLNAPALAATLSALADSDAPHGP